MLHSYLVSFENAKTISPAGGDRALFDSNFFFGNDPAKWRTDVPNYNEVVYEDLYDGIDLVYRMRNGEVKYEFVVQPGANPSAIAMSIIGADSVGLDAGGLVIDVGTIEARDSLPYSYQNNGREVQCEFAIRAASTFGFSCENWDASRQLTIDPLVYSTFLGGNSEDVVSEVRLAIDVAGAAYVAGYTGSIGFPTTPGAYDDTQSGSWDAFVAELNPSGTSLLFSTFLGDTSTEVATSVAIDSTGNISVGGWTLSPNFPVTPGAFDTTYNGNRDGFVAKLTSAGNQLLASTFLGGSDNDVLHPIALDALGNVYVSGVTNSFDFPVTVGAFQTTFGGFNDGYAAKFDSRLSILIYATYLGGAGEDEAHSIAVDSVGYAYVCGHAGDSDFPTTPGSYDPIYNGGNDDGFVLKLSANGDSLLYSTFLGSTGDDDIYALTLGAGGDVHVAGYSLSSGFPTTPGAFDRTFNGGANDVVVASIDSTGGSLVHSTYIGGSAEEVAYAIAQDSLGNTYITGRTLSSDFPISSGAFDEQANGGADTFMTKLNAAGTSLRYSTYIGGTFEDQGNMVVADPSGGVYVAGFTASADFPTTSGAYDTTYNGDPFDGYVLKLFANNAPQAINLGVQSYMSPPGIIHITDFTPDLNWTYSDTENDPQTQYEVRVSRVLGGSDMWAPGARAGAATMVTYAGSPLVRGTDYWFGVRVSDGQWGAWNDTMFHVNSIPTPPPWADDPLDMSTVPSNPSQQVTWGPGSDAESDMITYDWQVASDATFTSILSSGTTTATSSSPFATSAGETIYWRARARDDYEPTTWSDYGNNPLGYWMFFVVDGPPIAVAYAPFIVGHLNDVMWFDGSNSTDDVGIVSYLWEFGDGATNANMITSHQYSSRGIFVVNLTVSDTVGQNDTDSLTIEIQNRPPIADAGSDHHAIKRGIVTLDGTGSSDPDGDVLAYSWTQIAGPQVSLSNAGSVVATFTATSAGSLTFRLEVNDGEGGTDFDTVTIVVWGLPPTAVLTANPSRTFTGISIRFDGANSNDPDGVIVDYSFDFDDGTRLVGTDVFRDHVYKVAGTYNVTLSVRDDDGNTSIAWAIVVVDPPTTEPNWKPLVALLFSITIGLLGIWSSRKHPWKGVPTREAAFKTWSLTAAPLVVVEAVTGVVSMFTGLLRIPPVVDIGTVVDVTILCVGIGLLVVFGYTGRLLEPNPKPPENQ